MAEFGKWWITPAAPGYSPAFAFKIKPPDCPDAIEVVEIGALLCDFCQNTGLHACPDVVPIIDIPCSKEGCIYGKLRRLQTALVMCSPSWLPEDVRKIRREALNEI